MNAWFKTSLARGKKLPKTIKMVNLNKSNLPIIQQQGGNQQFQEDLNFDDNNNNNHSQIIQSAPSQYQSNDSFEIYLPNSKNKIQKYPFGSKKFLQDNNHSQSHSSEIQTKQKLFEPINQYLKQSQSPFSEKIIDSSSDSQQNHKLQIQSVNSESLIQNSENSVDKYQYNYIKNSIQLNSSQNEKIPQKEPKIDFYQNSKIYSSQQKFDKEQKKNQKFNDSIKNSLFSNRLEEQQYQFQPQVYSKNRFTNDFNQSKYLMMKKEPYDYLPQSSLLRKNKLNSITQTQISLQNEASQEQKNTKDQKQRYYTTYNYLQQTNKNTSSNERNINIKIPVRNVTTSTSHFLYTNNQNRTNESRNMLTGTLIRNNNETNNYRQSLNSNTNYRNRRRFTNTNTRNMTTRQDKQHIISLVQYCSSQIGIACFNVNTGQITLSQMIQRMTYTKIISTLQLFFPQEILFPQTQRQTFFLRQLMDNFHDISFIGVKRQLFNQTQGLSIYQQRTNKQDIIPQNNFLAFAALHALISRLESSLNTKLNLISMKISWHLIDDVMIIDRQTLFNLEIFMNRAQKNKVGTFYQNFNCFTIGGSRMLRSNIMQPFCDLQKITRRQKLLQLLFDDSSLFKLCEIQFPKFKYFQSITGKFIYVPPLNDIKRLKSYLKQILHISQFCYQLKTLKPKLTNWKEIPLIGNLQSLIGSSKISHLKAISQEYFDNQILQGYQTDFHKNNKKDHFIFLFKIEKFQEPMVQIERFTYTQSMDNIRKQYKQISQKAGVNIKLMQNPIRGYYLSAKPQIDLKLLSQKIQDDIVCISQKSKFVTFSTGRLASLNNRVKQNQNKLILRSEILLRNVIQKIQQNLGILFDVNYYISSVDTVLSFYKFIKRNPNVNFVAPTFNRNQNCFQTQKMRMAWTRERFLRSPHQLNLNINQIKPMLLFQSNEKAFNHLQFLYSIGYIAILGQIGCFVPASKAQLSMFDQIVSKSSRSLQSVEYNLSHFESQIINVRNIMHNVKYSKRSLILIQELIKGTQYEDECAISLAFLDSLSQNNVIVVCGLNDYYLINLVQQASFVQIFKDVNNSRSIQDKYEEVKKVLIQEQVDQEMISDFLHLQIRESLCVNGIFDDYRCNKVKAINENESIANYQIQQINNDKNDKNDNNDNAKYVTKNGIKNRQEKDLNKNYNSMRRNQNLKQQQQQFYQFQQSSSQSQSYKNNYNNRDSFISSYDNNKSTIIIRMPNTNKSLENNINQNSNIK